MEEILRLTFAGNTVTRYLSALAVLLVFLAMIAVLRGWVSGKTADLVAARTAPHWGELIRRLAGRTRVWVAVVVGVALAAGLLVLPERLDQALNRAAVLAALFQVGSWCVTLVTSWVDRKARMVAEESPEEVTTLRGVAILAKVGVWTVLLLIALDNMGFEITALLAGLGVGGVAVALAVQNILGDLFASLTIVLDKPFVVGDFITVGDLMGTVEYIGLKTTRLQSLSGEELVFSNNDLLQSRVRNYRKMRERRCVFQLGVTYQTSSEKLRRIPSMIRDIIEVTENTRFDRAHFKAYGDFSLNFEVVYFVLAPEYGTYMDTQEKINLEIFTAFEREEIEFAYPTRTLHVNLTNPPVPPERPMPV